MILEIRFSNFFSISEEVVLDLRAGSLNTKQSKDLLNQNTVKYDEERVLKTIAIYGANASGKTTLIKALSFCVDLILRSHTYNNDKTFDFTPFKLDKKFVERPSKFYISFVIDEIEYRYSFGLNRTEILWEKLIWYPNKRPAKIFSREERFKTGDLPSYSFGSVIKKPKTVAENTTSKTLYLSRASQFGREAAKKVYGFFSNKIQFGLPSLQDYFTKELFDIYKDGILQGLKMADSDIIDIKARVDLINNPWSNEKGDKLDYKLESIIYTTHHKRDPNVEFDLWREESAGTVKLFQLLINVFSIIINRKIWFIDELETHLHSNLVEFILNLFHSSGESQFIFTTHNTNLLSFKLFRKDQIYFVNKNQKSTTELYSLYDFKDFREGMNPENAYLSGRFDAVPVIQTNDVLLKEILLWLKAKDSQEHE